MIDPFAVALAGLGLFVLVLGAAVMFLRRHVAGTVQAHARQIVDGYSELRAEIARLDRERDDLAADLGSLRTRVDRWLAGAAQHREIP